MEIIERRDVCGACGATLIDGLFSGLAKARIELDPRSWLARHQEVNRFIAGSNTLPRHKSLRPGRSEDFVLVVRSTLGFHETTVGLRVSAHQIDLPLEFFLEY